MYESREMAERRMRRKLGDAVAGFEESEEEGYGCVSSVCVLRVCQCDLRVNYTKTQGYTNFYIHSYLVNHASITE